MANSIITEIGDGVTTQFALNFTLGIFKREFITCRVGDEVDGLGEPLYRTLEWITDGLVNIQGTVPGNLVPIVFARTMPKDELIHDYSDGVPITEKNLDESNLQHIMSIHEFLDGRLDTGFVQDLNLNEHKIINVADGTDPNDAVNLSQLEDRTGNAPIYATAAAASAAAALVSENNAETAETNAETAQVAAEAARDAALAAAAGMKWRPEVVAATTANITLSGEQAIDGVSVVSGDRVLVKNQSTASQNGVYVVATGSWTRSTDADSWNELVSQVVAVISGTSNADLIYICTSNSGGTLGSTAVTWTSINLPLQDNEVTTTKILNGAVTFAKIDSASIASQSDWANATASKLLAAVNFLPALKAAVGVSKYFESSEISLTTNTLTTVAHGMGTTPKEIWAVMRCKIAELGYSVGDEVCMDNWTYTQSSTENYNNLLAYNATNVYLRTGVGGSSSLIRNLSTGSVASPTAANWRWVVRARA